MDHGADNARCATLLAAEGMDDPDWRMEALREVASQCDSFYNLASEILMMQSRCPTGHLEKWLLSVLQSRVKVVEDSLSKMKNRTALETAFYEVWNDFRWYLRRRESPDSETLKRALSIWVRIMTPFIPHLCEEIWEKMKGKDFVSNASWPVHDETEVDHNAEAAERIVKGTMEDTQHLLQAIKVKPTRICYYVASPWKWRVYLKALEKSSSERIERGPLIKELMRDPILRDHSADLASFSGRMIEQIVKSPRELNEERAKAGEVSEKEVLGGANRLYSTQFDVDIYVYDEDDEHRYDPKKRATLAQPYRPAIFIE
jgi:leucyl-tRNA synthetase